MPPLETAARQLRAILDADESAPEWRWNVRLRLTAVKEALSGAQGLQTEAWLTARTQFSDRERIRLLARVSALASGVLDKLEPVTVVHEVRRLLGDVERHVQRRHDLVYDSVSSELGGSD